MKIQHRFAFLLGVLALSWTGIGNALAGEGLAINPIYLDAVTKVSQQHNPGIGLNYLALNIEGKSGGKPMSLSITVNNPGWGAQKLFESCEKDAMLAFHYPSRYGFEIISSETGKDGSATLHITDSNSDPLICSLKTKENSRPLDPGVLQSAPAFK